MKRASLVLLLIVGFAATPVAAQLLDALPRHAHWAASFEGPSDSRAGARVRSVTPGGFAEQIGLAPGDLILKVNDVALATARDFEKVMQSTSIVRGGSQVTLEVAREGGLLRKTGAVPAVPRESFPGVTTDYRSILSPYGYRVQVIVTRPANSRGRMPGIFLVRWMSCDPVEKPVSRKHGVARILEDFVQKSGFAVMRVEKSGLGDSEGPSCYDADFQHELAAHQEAYRVFRGLDFVDESKVMVFAQSNGAAYAPLVTGELQPAAYVVTGGWAKTWYEHMLEYKRRSFALQGDPPAEITRKMKLVAELYTEYLIRKKVPGEIIAEKPYLRGVWDGEYRHKWGLPVTYMQQLQELDIPSAWSKVKVPTFVFYGEYDFAMAEDDHRAIADLVNRNGKDLARFEFIPQMHHSLFWFENQRDAYTDFYGKGVYREELANRILAWMKQALAK